ncbi:hypothetical protein ABHI18_011238 [Aspergillus niger]
MTYSPSTGEYPRVYPAGYTRWNDSALGTWSKVYYETYLRLLEISSG